jgi:spermidine synthase
VNLVHFLFFLANNFFHFLITGLGDGSVYEWNVKNGKVRQIVVAYLFHMITSVTVERL